MVVLVEKRGRSRFGVLNLKDKGRLRLAQRQHAPPREGRGDGRGRGFWVFLGLHPNARYANMIIDYTGKEFVVLQFDFVTTLSTYLIRIT